MRPLLPAILLAAACSPSGADADSRLPDPAPDYATQLEAPAPDYSKLIVRPYAEPRGEIERRSSARPPSDAKAVGALWVERLEQRGALMGHGLSGKSPDAPVQSIDTLLTAKEFDAWLAENGWTAPRHIDWRFQAELVAPRVSAAARPKVRVWPASTQRTGWQLEAAFQGRVYVRDGCLFMRGHDGVEKLAWLHAETGLDVDSEGYLVLVNRVSGETSARLGEDMTWAGPNGAPQGGEAVARLREACGDQEIEAVGNPQSVERMMVQYPHLRDRQAPPPPPGA